MHNNPLLNLCNAIRTNKQNRFSTVKIQFSKKSIAILSVFLKEGFIRGFFIEVENNFKVIHILLKHSNNDLNFLKFKKTSLIERQTYYSSNYFKNQSMGLHFSIVSTQKGIMSNADAAALGLGGFLLINTI